MKNRIKILLGAVIGSSLLLSSCNFLDVDNYFQATFKEDSIFHSMKNAEGYLWNTPTRFPDAGAIWGNSWNPGETASDEIDVRPTSFGEHNSVLVLSTEETCGRIYGIACM